MTAAPAPPAYPLPDLLREVRDEWGLDKALAFAAAFGGRVIYVPHTAQGGSAIAKIMGAPFLAWLVARRGGGSVVVPLGPYSSDRERARLICTLLDEGRSTSEIVRLARCHERTVRRHQSRRRQTAAQGEFSF